MSAILLSLLGNLWPYLMAGAAALFGLFRYRQSIIKGERAKQVRAEAKARDIADQVDNDIGALPADAAREELTRWSKS